MALRHRPAADSGGTAARPGTETQPRSRHAGPHSAASILAAHRFGEPAGGPSSRSRCKPAPWMRPAAARVSSLTPGAAWEQPDAFDGERSFIRSNN